MTVTIEAEERCVLLGGFAFDGDARLLPQLVDERLVGDEAEAVALGSAHTPEWCAGMVSLPRDICGTFFSHDSPRPGAGRRDAGRAAPTAASLLPRRLPRRAGGP